MLPALLPGEQGERSKMASDTIKAMTTLAVVMASDLGLCEWTILGLNQ